jgi:hypothetical protein
MKVNFFIFENKKACDGCWGYMLASTFLISLKNSKILSYMYILSALEWLHARKEPIKSGMCAFDQAIFFV